MDAADLLVLASPSTKTFVEVECDSLEFLGTFSNDKAGYACHIGPQVLPVVAGTDRQGARSLVGTLVAMSSPLAEETWPHDVRSANAVLPIYLTEQAIRGSQVAAVLCIVGEALLLALIGFWIARRARR